MTFQHSRGAGERRPPLAVIDLPGRREPQREPQALSASGSDLGHELSREYNSPEECIRLSELAAPTPIANVSEAPINGHETLEGRMEAEHEQIHPHETIIHRLHSYSQTQHRQHSSRRARRETSTAVASASPIDHARSIRSSEAYAIPNEYANLNEASPLPPVENPDEAPIYRHHSLEERFEPPEEPEAELEVVPDEESTPTRRLQRTAFGQASLLLTEIYTVSYLILFSILGTLVRLGLQALTFYPGGPVTFGILWVNFAGTLFLGFLAEASQLFTGGQPPPSPKQERGGSGGVRNAINRGPAELDLGCSTSEPPTDVDGAAENTQNDRPDPRPRPQPQQQQSQLSTSTTTRKTKPMPMYIGLATGFCGSVTSFSSFVLDAFLAATNSLPAPAYHDGEGASSSSFSLIWRGAGEDVMALLAVILLTLCVCLSALKFGAHLAIAARRMFRMEVPGRVRILLDKAAVILAAGSWVGAVLLAVYPPDRPGGPSSDGASSSWALESWRGQALFAIAFAPAGCLLRFYISLKLNAVFASFPLGTFTVNFIGTALLGMAWDLQHAPSSGTGASRVACQVLQGFMDGFCGCLTTVSTWMAELSGLRRKNSYLYGTVSVVASLAVLVVVIGTLKWTVGWKDPICLAH